MTYNRDMVARKIAEMPVEQVMKLLLFMADMELQDGAAGQREAEKPRKASKQSVQMCT